MPKPKKQPKRQIPATLWKKVLEFNAFHKDKKDKLEKEQKVEEVKEKSKIFGFWEKRKLKNNPDECYIINMHYGNGTSRLFVLRTTDNVFIHKGKMYLLIHEECWFNLSIREYLFNFHENCVVPINRELEYKPNPEYPNDDMKAEAFYSVTPSNMEKTIKMEYVKALVNSVELTSMLKLILIVAIMGAGIALINAIMYYYQNKGG
jgi:hypothetical protein